MPDWTAYDLADRRVSFIASLSFYPSCTIFNCNSFFPFSTFRIHSPLILRFKPLVSLNMPSAAPSAGVDVYELRLEYDGSPSKEKSVSCWSYKPTEKRDDHLELTETISV